jgi:hypothetical protein
MCIRFIHALIALYPLFDITKLVCWVIKPFALLGSIYFIILREPHPVMTKIRRVYSGPKAKKKKTDANKTKI